MKKVNLALQGGGAHGAFTWGILDTFLEQNAFTIEGISATSAGSMNAVVLAQGMLEGGNEGARQLLYDFWKAMSEYGKMYSPNKPMPIDFLLEPFLKVPINFYLFSSIVNLLSPYQVNPFNFNPIKQVLEKIIDIKKIKKQGHIKLFICATNVKTGKIRIFSTDELSINAIVASACLPRMFQSVEVNHEYYWDGGYLGNPAIFPLIYNTNVSDIIVLHTVPIVRQTLPTTVLEIDARLREISFNSSLMREMRAIAFITKMIDEGWLKKEYESKLKRIHMHCIRADKALRDFSLASVYSPDWDFLITLRNLGRHAAENWLHKHSNDLGEKSTIQLEDWL
jgi:NTE family protein